MILLGAGSGGDGVAGEVAVQQSCGCASVSRGGGI